MFGCNSFPVIDMAATGKRINEFREKSKLTVREIQNYFGFEYPQAVYKWVNGKTLPSVDNLLALAALFEQQMQVRVHMDDLLVYADQEVDHFFSAFF